jgi:protein O-GlcNAc transferase
MKRAGPAKCKPRRIAPKRAEYVNSPNPGKLSDYLRSHNGKISLSIPDGILPSFLIDAFNATIKGEPAKAAISVGPKNIGFIDRMVAEERPGHMLASVILAMVFQRLGHLDAAIQRYEAIVAIEPNALILNELGEICLGMGYPSRALDYQKRAIKVDPHDYAIKANYALCLIKAGRIRAGVDLLEALVASGDVTESAHSCLLMYLHYLPRTSRQKLLDVAKHWGRIHAPVDLARRAHSNAPDPYRKLRIGYLSADFRSHSVAYNFEAILDGCDRDLCELHGYGHVVQPDFVTERLASKFDKYRSVLHMDDPQLAHQIEQDRIDILVALAGHTKGHRLRALAYKPAPIQVDLGGIGSTGMEQVDYRLTDLWLDPPGGQSYYLEELAYLDGGYICYRPPDVAPLPGPLPALQNGYVTFCSFNNHLKTNDDTVAMWAQVLHVCPGSRMLLKCQMGPDRDIRRFLLEKFHRHGVAPDRIKLVPWQPAQQHLQTYHQVDIALDTYPFSGWVTTSEGLWMGVPVISLAGVKFVSRGALTLLHPLDMSAFCAATPEQYVAKARALAENLPALAQIRAGLRPRMQASPLCDARRYGRVLEKAYRKMWTRWCHERVSRPACAASSSVRGDGIQ